MRLLLILAVLLCFAGVAQASPFSIPTDSIDFGLYVWNPLDGSPGATLPTVGMKFYKIPVDPTLRVDTPTNLNEIDEWAKQNLRADLAFRFSDYTTLDFAGLGISESVKVAQIMDVPVRMGIGYLSGGPSWCYYWGASVELK